MNEQFIIKFLGSDYVYGPYPSIDAAEADLTEKGYRIEDADVYPIYTPAELTPMEDQTDEA